MSVVGVHHTSRSVGDMDRSLAFYRDLLGLEVLLDTEMSGEMLELLQYHSPPSRDGEELRPCDVGAHHVALAVEDIQSDYERLSDAGVEFTCPPQEVDAGYFAGHRTVYCYDPDHMIVELWQVPA